jgi:hypothetical protein
VQSTFKPTVDENTVFERGHSPRDVYIFGAGLSMPCGFPSAAGFWKAAYNWNVNTHRNLNLSYVIEVIEYFYPNVTSEAMWNVDLEDLLGMFQAAAEYWKMRGGSRGYRWRPDFLEKAKDQLIRLMGEYLWHLHPDSYQSLMYLRNIVRKHRDGVCYITFNYDLLLEIALSEENIDYTYSIDRSKPNGVVIFKPHGSINWFRKSTIPRYQSWIEQNCHLIQNFDTTDMYFFTKFSDDFLSSRINPKYSIMAPYPFKTFDDFLIKKRYGHPVLLQSNPPKILL